MDLICMLEALIIHTCRTIVFIALTQDHF
jgi:hypothetical protein